MNKFSATHAAFTGFRLIQSKPQIILWWAAVMFVQTVISGGCMILFGGGALARLESPELKNDPTAISAAFAQAAPALLVASLIGFAVYAVFYAATYRAVLRPQEDRAGYLRFGVDELLQLGALLLVGLVVFAAYFGLVLAAVVVIISVAAMSKVAAVFVGVPVVISAIGALLFIVVRLSLTNAVAFDTRQISLPTSWRLTKGRFWPILGAYMLAAIFAFIVYMLGLTIFMALAAVTGGVGAAGAVFKPDTTSMATYFTPITLIYLVFSALLWPLGLTLLVGPSASIYQSLTADPSEVF
ncbi:hypothetical protein C5708_02645 [Caulobacter sp. CCUG 60055]|uniref:hypothetical protein n=1 Tax=Caulobacter sp. CCUG 60055 TaxID=2100090 RepID=UPI001FA74BDD|nr:hypothetical protein [Caulobacter sp. CCUG 60055]MBQ1540947.1 hypothetical protein [Caulobacteraceae bacterium]MCI3179145.1 hypothetical protein [Caulobacter sp. CCUG 60055]